MIMNTSEETMSGSKIGFSDSRLRSGSTRLVLRITSNTGDRETLIRHTTLTDSRGFLRTVVYDALTVAFQQEE